MTRSHTQRPDPRRFIPRTDELMSSEPAVAARRRLAGHVVRAIINDCLEQARSGDIEPQDVREEVAHRLALKQPYSLRRVLNATGVIVHTNLGRAALPEVSVEALQAAAGYTDVELDLDSGLRSAHRGAGAQSALLAACPGAEDALVVNNGAAALLLATTALAENQEVIISRGELIEIGAGFRLPELIESARVTLREVGATNRTHPADYEHAMHSGTGAVLKVHPSNFRIEGFTSAVEVATLRALIDATPTPAHLIVDLGSGLLNTDSSLPVEPDLNAQLEAGADIVIASGDKLLGGPQAGIILGTADAVSLLRKHPLARALRIDKLRLNALEAALNAPANAVAHSLHADPDVLRQRCDVLAARVGGDVVEHTGRVGGGGAPEYPLPGWAVSLPEELARPLRLGEPAVLPRVNRGACLIDLRCIPDADDDVLARAIEAAQAGI